MARKTIYMLALMLMPLFAAAQNSIDEMVDELSTIGGAKFTSVVQRNPKTRAIEKVVKKLEIGGMNSKKFINAFKNETRRNKTTTTTYSDGEVTTIITTSNQKTNRIYMIKYEDEQYYPDVSVTIIVKVK